MTRTFDWVNIFSYLKMHIKADMCSNFLSIVSDHTVGFCGRGKAKTAILGANISVFQHKKLCILLLWLIGIYISVIFHKNKICAPLCAKGRANLIYMKNDPNIYANKPP